MYSLSDLIFLVVFIFSFFPLNNKIFMEAIFISLQFYLFSISFIVAANVKLLFCWWKKKSFILN